MVGDYKPTPQRQTNSTAISITIPQKELGEAGKQDPKGPYSPIICKNILVFLLRCKPYGFS